MRHKLILTALSLLTCICAYAQQATLSGVVKDDQGNIMEQVTVAIEGTGVGTHTNTKGAYTLEVPAERNINVVYSFIGFEVLHKTLYFKAGEKRNVDVTLKGKVTALQEFVKKDDRSRYEAGSVTLDVSKANMLPSTIGGIEGLIKMQTGSHSELTTQYSVRGGSFDENLVYVNDFEIYRPYLTHAGQQEGLSFVNADLVSNVYFSVGGFQAKYGDKMSSVLDVTYKHPTEFAGSVMMSLLGAELHLEGASKDKKLTYLIGARQKSNQYLLQSQPTKGVYNPSFSDIQALVNYRFNDKWEVEAIGNYARNRFTFYPQSSSVSFGVVNQAYQLNTSDAGSELDQFDAMFGGVSLTYRPNKKTKLKLLGSHFQTREQETYDIMQEYSFGQVETDLGKNDFGQIKTYLGTGFIHQFARNYLDLDVSNIAFRGSYDAGKHFISFGQDLSITHINDDLHEWEFRDSAAYNQPLNPNLIIPHYLLNGAADFGYNRIGGFVQDNFRFSDSARLTGSLGVRYVYSFLNNELDVSPRLQLAYRPQWRHDVIFKFATGQYVQPPFYREMRGLDGAVNKDLLSQKAVHVVLGVDYNFKKYGRPFKITGELYYKDLRDIDPYIYEDVRIRYTGKNDAVGYVYGGELRLYGDMVKDATSWISVGIMKGMQKLTDSSSGWFPLPSDQRFTLGMYFEDYLPHNKNFKMHLNLMYATGLPFSPPSNHIYDNVLRLPDYKRVDIGFSALLLDGSRKERPAHSMFSRIKSIWGSFEVFNLLDIQNTISYSWIQDQTTNNTFAIPNRLTPRLINVKLIFRF